MSKLLLDALYMKLADKLCFTDKGRTHFGRLRNSMNHAERSDAEIRNTSIEIHGISLEREVLAGMTASERQIAAKQRGSVEIAAARGLMRQFIEAAKNRNTKSKEQPARHPIRRCHVDLHSGADNR